MRRTLLIIDMQKEFLDLPRENDLLLEIAQQINKAKKYKWNIMLVEYSGCGKTIAFLRKAIGRYKRLFKVEKTDDDGALEILGAMLGNRLDPFIRVCGVNSDICVYETMSSLVQMVPKCKFELVSNGCGSFFCKSQKEVLGHLRAIKLRRRNVKII